MRILVVEDYELLRDSIVQGLEDAGFAVDAAGDGETALWQARAGGYDVIVLDLMLPKIDGLEVLRRIRGDERTRLLTVVVLTTSNEEHDIAESYHLGANGFVRKPVVFADFVAAVNAVGVYWLLVNEPPPAGPDG